MAALLPLRHGGAGAGEGPLARHALLNGLQHFATVGRLLDPHHEVRELARCQRCR